MTQHGKRTILTGDKVSYLRRRSYGEVEIRRNANGDFVVFHREVPAQVGVSLPWVKGDAFSEDMPMRDIHNYANALMKNYRDKRAAEGGGIDT